jgi:hypothetical protein
LGRLFSDCHQVRVFFFDPFFKTLVGVDARDLFGIFELRCEGLDDIESLACVPEEKFAYTFMRGQK